MNKVLVVVFDERVNISDHLKRVGEAISRGKIEGEIPSVLSWVLQEGK